MKIKEESFNTFKNNSKDSLKDVKLEYYTDMYEAWQTKQQLLVGREVRNNRKYCFASTTTVYNTSTWAIQIVMDTFDTNDGNMKDVAWWIKITRTWIYIIDASVRINSLSVAWRVLTLLKKNWAWICEHSDPQSFLWTTVDTPAWWVFQLNWWDIITLFLISTNATDTTSVSNQVTKLNIIEL